MLGGEVGIFGITVAIRIVQAKGHTEVNDCPTLPFD